jgi:hypothetical protein
MEQAGPRGAAPSLGACRGFHRESVSAIGASDGGARAKDGTREHLALAYLHSDSPRGLQRSTPGGANEKQRGRCGDRKTAFAHRASHALGTRSLRRSRAARHDPPALFREALPRRGPLGVSSGTLAHGGALALGAPGVRLQDRGRSARAHAESLPRQAEDHARLAEREFIPRSHLNLRGNP